MATDFATHPGKAAFQSLILWAFGELCRSFVDVPDVAIWVIGGE